MEVTKIRENRDRLKIEARTGGIGPGVSVVMYTFHNTQTTALTASISQVTTSSLQLALQSHTSESGVWMAQRLDQLMMDSFRIPNVS